MSYGAGAIFWDDLLQPDVVENQIYPAVRTFYAELVADLRRAFSSAFVECPPVSVAVGLPADVVSTVGALHEQGQFIAAADTALRYVVDLLDTGNYEKLNAFVAGLAASIASDADLYDNRGLARIHNVLALTFRHAGVLPDRGRLRLLYHDRVVSREGVAAADDAVSLL